MLFKLNTIFEKTALFAVFQHDFDANEATSSKRADDAFYLALFAVFLCDFDANVAISLERANDAFYMCTT